MNWKFIELKVIISVLSAERVRPGYYTFYNKSVNFGDTISFLVNNNQITIGTKEI